MGLGYEECSKIEGFLMDLNNLVQTCDACPSQWEASLKDRRNVYIRYRWGHLQIWVSNKPREDALNGKQVYSKQLGTGMDGILSEGRMLKIIKNLQS